MIRWTLFAVLHSLSLSLDEIVRSLICSSQFLPLDYTELPPSCILRCTYLQNSLLNFAAVNAARVLLFFFLADAAPDFALPSTTGAVIHSLTCTNPGSKLLRPQGGNLPAPDPM